MASVEWLPTNDLRRIHDSQANFNVKTENRPDNRRLASTAVAAPLFGSHSQIKSRSANSKPTTDWMSEYFVKSSFEST